MTAWPRASDGNGGSPPLSKWNRLDEVLSKGYCELKGIVIVDWTIKLTADPIEITSFGSVTRSFVAGRSQTELHVVFMHTDCEVPDDIFLNSCIKSLQKTFNTEMLKELNITYCADRAIRYDCVVVGESSGQIIGYFRDMIYAMFGSDVKRMPSMVEMLEI